jgi:hypothetical protein
MLGEFGGVFRSAVAVALSAVAGRSLKVDGFRLNIFLLEWGVWTTLIGIIVGNFNNLGAKFLQKYAAIESFAEFMEIAKTLKCNWIDCKERDPHTLEDAISPCAMLEVNLIGIKLWDNITYFIKETQTLIDREPTKEFKQGGNLILEGGVLTLAAGKKILDVIQGIPADQVNKYAIDVISGTAIFGTAAPLVSYTFQPKMKDLSEGVNFILLSLVHGMAPAPVSLVVDAAILYNSYDQSEISQYYQDFING